MAADILGWVVADGFGWLQMVSGGFRWFVVLAVTVISTVLYVFVCVFV